MGNGATLSLYGYFRCETNMRPHDKRRAFYFSPSETFLEKESLFIEISAERFVLANANPR